METKRTTVKIARGAKSWEGTEGLYALADGTLVVYIGLGTVVDIRRRLADKHYEAKMSAGTREYWFRATFNADETTKLVGFRSKDHATGHQEAGMSVSEHPYYQSAFGYPYIYVVTGDVLATGADSEPVLGNVKALTEPAEALPAEWAERHKRETSASDPCPGFDAMQCELVDATEAFDLDAAELIFHI